jgi:hypothetical protein
MYRSVFLVASAALAFGGTLAFTACSSNDELATEAAPTEPDGGSRRISQKGEVCQVTNDCATGLVCIPFPGTSGGVCGVSSFGITRTAKECVAIECRDALDCCPVPPPNCAQLLAGCNDGGIAVLCAQYEAYCKCDATKRECAADKCIVKCASDLDCASSPGSRCLAGRCGVCSTDADCGANNLCADGACIPACRSDGDCLGFARCTSGRCVDSGCKTDRECVAATRNVEAKCGVDGKCTSACESDVECANPKGYSFVSCIDKRCTYTGCESDKDCRLFGSPQPGDIGKPIGRHLVCRDAKR